LAKIEQIDKMPKITRKKQVLRPKISKSLHNFLSKQPEHDFSLPKIERKKELIFSEIIPSKLYLANQQSNLMIEKHDITAIISFNESINSKSLDSIYSDSDQDSNPVSDKNTKSSTTSEIKTMNIEISDTCRTDIKSHFENIIQFINNNETVLITSNSAKSRSATAVIAYLMTMHDMDLQQAYDFLSSKNSAILPNFSFLGQLKFHEISIRNEDIFDKDSGLGW